MSFYNEMNKRQEQLEVALDEVEQYLGKHTFPDGTLEIARNGNGFKWFNVHMEKGRKVRKYIPVKDEPIVRRLALKKYYIRKHSAILNELKAIRLYLKYYPKELPDNLFYENPEYRRLLQKQISFLRDKVYEWSISDFEKKPQHIENVNIRTLRGDLVRSKSEAMIADALFRAEIPYRYECKLELGGITIYPDFTIMNPETGELKIWEHFGLMDSAEYIRTFAGKMKLYAENGYIPNRNLIMSFEDSDHPLGSAEIYKIIESFFGKTLLY